MENKQQNETVLADYLSNQIRIAQDVFKKDGKYLLDYLDTDGRWLNYGFISESEVAAIQGKFKVVSDDIDYRYMERKDSYILCRCGITYRMSEFMKLSPIMYDGKVTHSSMPYGIPGIKLIHRNCPCGTTLSVPVTKEGQRYYPKES